MDNTLPLYSFSSYTWVLQAITFLYQNRHLPPKYHSYKTIYDFEYDKVIFFADYSSSLQEYVLWIVNENTRINPQNKAPHCTWPVNDHSQHAGLSLIFQVVRYMQLVGGELNGWKVL